jgi:predicted PurR-regulated permease PerM
VTFRKLLLQRWLWGLSSLALFILLAWRLERLAILVLLSFLVAYVLNPLVTRLARLRLLGRTSATLITLTGLVVGILAVAFVIIPEVVGEVRQFLTRLPTLSERFTGTAIPWIEQHLGVAIPDTFGSAFDQAVAYAQGEGSRLIGPASSILGGIVGRTTSFLFAVVGSLMFPLFLFFLLKDFPRIIDAIDNLVPVRNRVAVREVGHDVDRSLSAFLHGQFTVMLILGTLYSIGYSIVGVPVAVGVGLLTGLLCFIPYVGAATGLILALLLSALEMRGFNSVLGALIVFGVVQLLDAVLITPKILGGKLGLRPLWIIVALMAGAELFGFLGVLLAVPTTAVLKVLVTHTLDKYRKSDLYLTTDAADTGAPPGPGSSGVPAGGAGACVPEAASR